MQKKYTTKFPVARIKKIMQLDEDVGKVAQATPVMIAKASELFMYSLLEKSLEQARQLQSQRISPYHMYS
ncbi:DNA-directed DNA polymerase epsilon, subunit C [Coelomomyces lativittatus]|nr:DNA-directed DNA polymerase epsilon, subunit C [Coelomomyces lativittatus]